MKPEAIARICHEANRAYCETLGDCSQVQWSQASEHQKTSCIKGVEFCLGNPMAPVSANHESWFNEKRAAGWRFGPEKNEIAKTHPCMVAYEMLPIEQRMKDHLFKAIVATLSTNV